MKCLTREETEAWLKERSMWAGHREPLFDENWIEQFADLPLTSTEQSDLSRQFVDAMSPFDGAMLSLTERTLCEDDESPIILERVRLSYGEKRPIFDAPTFEFDSSEAELCIAVVRLFVMFCWDGYLLSSSLKYAVKMYGHEGLFATLAKK